MTQRCTTYDYDALDRMTSKTYPDTTVYSYVYDPTHNATQVTDPNGSAVVQTWDAGNRMTRRDVTLGTDVVGPTVETYTYDGLDRVTQAVSGSVTTNLTYDSLSRVLSEATNGKMVGYAYDDAANPVELSYPSGHVVARTFDNLNRPSSIGEKLAGGGVDPSVTYGYRGPHLLAETSYGNGITGTRQFDAARRMLSELKTSPTGSTVFQEGLSWSPRSLKVAQSRGDRNGSGLVLSYDGAQRLTCAARRPAPTAQAGNNTVPDPATLVGVPEVMGYQYDSSQNLLARTERKAGVGQTTNLPVDGSGRNRPGSVNGVTLEYDANGNLSRKGNLYLDYDFRNRLTRVKDGVGQEVVTYSYDALNRRISKTVSGVTEETVWSGWQAIEEYQTGQLSRQRTFGRGLDEVVEVSRDLDGDGTLEANYVPLYDSSGFLAAMTGPDGKPVERYEYTPFGTQTILVDSTPPAVEQVRWVAGELWLEMSEEVSAEALAEAVNAGTLTLKDTLATQNLSISVTQPVDEGHQARERVVMTPADPLPAAGTELSLTLPPESLVDLFLNEPSTPFTLTFNWPATDAVLFDDVPPKVEQVVVLDGFLEVQLSEEPDVATATSAINLDGQPLVWTLQADGYTLRSDSTLALGSHTLDVAIGLSDLQGQALAQPESFVFELGASVDDLLVYQVPDPRVTPTSTVGNRVGFQGHEKDLETGLIYVRNRYYDPELGRFITADPMGYTDGPSMYQFGGYSPMNFGDPLGLQHDLQHPIWTAEQASAENTTAADIPDFPPGPVTKAYSEAAAAALDAENPASVRVVQGLTALVYAPFAGLEQIGRSLANTPHEVVESIGENFRCRALAVEVSEQKLSPEDSQIALESQDCATVMGPGIAQAPVGPGRLGRVGRNTSRAAREAAESLKLASGNLDEAAAAARTQRHGPIARIQFGRVQNQVDHAFRHTDQIGLARSDVQAAIRQDLSESANLLQEGLNVRTVRVGDVEVTYNAFRFSDDTINVGRITP